MTETNLDHFRVEATIPARSSLRVLAVQTVGSYAVEWQASAKVFYRHGAVEEREVSGELSGTAVASVTAHYEQQPLRSNPP